MHIVLSNIGGDVMQPMLLAATVALLSVVWWPTPYALAADTRVARGVVAGVARGLLTLDVRSCRLTFVVDTTTHVEAVTVGSPVAVTYHEINGVLQASYVRPLHPPSL